jgi:hypothetical protein
MLKDLLYPANQNTTGVTVDKHKQSRSEVTLGDTAKSKLNVEGEQDVKSALEEVHQGKKTWFEFFS